MGSERQRLTTEQFLQEPERRVFRWVTGIGAVLAYLGAVVATYTLIFLVALGEASLPTAFMHWLGAAVLAELAPIFAYLTRMVWDIRSEGE